MKGLSLSSFSQNFLGQAPEWYKLTIVGFLIFNPLLMLLTGNAYLTGWVLVLEFIFTLAISVLFFKERSSPKELAGIALVAAGIIYLLAVAR